MTSGAAGIDTSRCNTSALCCALDDRDLLGHGQLSSGGYSDRDHDRARLLQYIGSHPEGVVRTVLTYHVLKGTGSGDRVEWPEPDDADRDSDAFDRYDADMARLYSRGGTSALDGSDADYQFTKRFTDTLESAGFVRLEASNAGIVVFPTLCGLDLISEGIRETHSGDDSLIYDREFCQNMLDAARTGKKRLSPAQKDTLARSLRRYIDRVNDYRLVFDVHLSGFRRSGSRRMTKKFNTRFNSSGRRDRAFARYQQSLEWMYEHGDTAVIQTLTTDPSAHESLLDAWQNINPNFHRLTQFLKSDPSTKEDTRRADVPGWRPDLDNKVTGRPRKRLEYLKVLESSSAGYPHLHVLWANPPRRDKDGMPWLIDSGELQHKWSDWGQGRITDQYPLVYRGDLQPEGDPNEPDDGGLRDLVPAVGSSLVDEGGWLTVQEWTEDTITRWYRREHGLGRARFNSSEGFVCWYRFGDHSHGEDWIREQTRYHDTDGLLDLGGDDENLYQKTAGSYLGKYLSETFKHLGDPPSEDELARLDHDADAKSAFWKLGMYWATGRQLWSISQGIRDAINRDDSLPGEVRRSIEDSVALSVLHHSPIEFDADASTPSGLADVFDPDARARDPERDRARNRSYLRDVVADSLVSIEFIGTYAYWDMPATSTDAVSLDALEESAHDPNSGVTLRSTGDRPPPTADVWS